MMETSHSHHTEDEPRSKKLGFARETDNQQNSLFNLLMLQMVTYGLGATEHVAGMTGKVLTELPRNTRAKERQRGHGGVGLTTLAPAPAAAGG